MIEGLEEVLQIAVFVAVKARLTAVVTRLLRIGLGVVLTVDHIGDGIDRRFCRLFLLGITGRTDVDLLLVVLVGSKLGDLLGRHALRRLCFFLLGEGSRGGSLLFLLGKPSLLFLLTELLLFYARLLGKIRALLAADRLLFLNLRNDIIGGQTDHENDEKYQQNDEQYHGDDRLKGGNHQATQTASDQTAADE